MHKGKIARAAILMSFNSLKDFAQHIQYSPQHLSRSLSKEEPGEEIIAAIERGLGVPEGTLFYTSPLPHLPAGADLAQLEADKKALEEKVEELEKELEETLRMLRQSNKIGDAMADAMKRLLDEGK